MPAHPIVIAVYDPRWPALFEVERARLQAAICDWVTGIEHIGSTSVPGLAAKPVIDILIGVRALGDVPLRSLLGAWLPTLRQGKPAQVNSTP